MPPSGRIRPAPPEWIEKQIATGVTVDEANRTWTSATSHFRGQVNGCLVRKRKTVTDASLLPIVRRSFRAGHDGCRLGGSGGCVKTIKATMRGPQCLLFTCLLLVLPDDSIGRADLGENRAHLEHQTRRRALARAKDADADARDLGQERAHEHRDGDRLSEPTRRLDQHFLAQFIDAEVVEDARTHQRPVRAIDTGFHTQQPNMQ